MNHPSRKTIFMRWDHSEYLLKGLYLGLLAMVAFHGPTWGNVGILAGATAGGLLLALAWSAFRRRREGGGRTLGYLFFLLLENPQAVFTGVVGGLALGAYWVVRESEQPTNLVAVALGGACLGYGLELLRRVRDAKVRLGVSLGIAAALIGGIAYIMLEQPELIQHVNFNVAGALIILGIPGFYLLTFASFEEETEAEIAALCGALGVGLWLLAGDNQPMRSFAVGVPLIICIGYIKYVLPGLRVFKHALRGLSFRQVGKIDRALSSLGRALELDPNHTLAREQLWELHRELDFTKVKDDPTIRQLINYPMCLERVRHLLLADVPQPSQIQEAEHLLELIAHQRPDLEPACWYWRTVAALHRRDYDAAETNLRTLLAGEAPADVAGRRQMLFAGWQLALLLHPEMKRRVGEPLVEIPARRFEAIAAVERQLVAVPTDQEAWDLKRHLYSPISEALYAAVVPEGTIRPEFDYGYVQEMGLALIEDAAQWPRGCELLRIAARGLPATAATLYVTIARAHEKHGDTSGMWANYQKAMQVGRAVGVANMAAADRQGLFAVVKQVGERAMAENEIDAALEAFKFYTEKDDAGVETYRTLAELFERKTDPWTALNCVEHALTYNPSDPDLLARKDRYVYSVTPEQLKQRWEAVGRWFDVEYCRTKALHVLEKGGGDLDLLDWASHLADLYGTAKPGSIESLVLRARVRRMRGEVPQAIELLEQVRQNKPEKFAGEAESDAWFVAHRLLGDLYLETNAAEAVKCFLEFRKSSRAGADTMYKLGRAYEATGDMARAARCYEEVCEYPQHPLYYDARDALERAKRGTRVG